MKTLPSFIFAVGGLVWTVILIVLYTPLFILPRRSIQVAARLWIRGVMGLLSVTVGLRYEVRGTENLPTGPAILASKHQSAWDTIIFHLLLNDPVFVLKKELFRVPFFGWYLRKVGSIGIDRSAGAGALKMMIREVERALGMKRQIIVFPEGTRVSPDEHIPYNPGIAALYGKLSVPVIPVALNSGVFWGRRSLRKYAGRITIEFLPPIPPGMNRRAFTQELETRIESASTRLKQEARQRFNNVPIPSAQTEKT